MNFFIIFSSVLFILYFYTGWNSIYPNQYSTIQNSGLWFLCFIFYLLPITTFYFKINKIESQILDLYTWVGYLSLGICSILFFTFLLLDIFTLSLNLVSTKSNFNPNRKAFLGLSIKSLLAGFGGIFSVYGIVNGIQKPKTITQKIKFINLPKDLNQFKIAHISDLHIGSQIKSDMVIDVVNKINKIKPDIIVFTGDAADGSVESYGKELNPFKKLKSKYGNYFVTGNHEYYSDLKGWLNKITNVGFKILINESNVIQIGKNKLLVSGIPDRSAKHYIKSHQTNMTKTLGKSSKIDFKILLAHQPKDIEYAIKYKYDLQLSGHTHGGQYYPFSFLVQLAHPFLKGLHKKGETQIYINQGTGYWGPSIRIGTVPEITEIILTKA
jgi:uncharacterized protein